MLCLHNIGKSYDRVILDHAQATFETNKIYVVKGISGSGKSTLLNIIGGVDSEYTGEVTYNSRVLGGDGGIDRESYRQQVGYVFQHSLLFAQLTNEENLLFFKNDPALIREYARLFGVEALLDKYPTTLSGGERQRFSIIRALIQSKTIWLMDEPTASLDAENSRNIAQALSQLKSSDRIIIIATHEDCFDKWADAILYIEEGHIRVQEQAREASPKETIPLIPSETAKKPHTLRYVFKRKKRSYRLSLLPLSLVMLILFCGIALQSAFTREAFKKMIAQYPISVYSEFGSTISELEAQYPGKVKVYEDYQITDGDVTACALLDKEDSAFYYQNNIAYGSFPEQDDEIVISQEYAKQKMNAASVESCLHQTITFAGRTYKITGILDDPESETFLDAFSSNIYYCNTEGIQIYVTYSEAMRYGTIQERGLKMIRLDGMNSDPAVTAYATDLYGGENPSYWGRKIEEIQYIINMIYGAILGIVAIVGLISMFFIMNDIRLELHYRRKEFGYLKLFGVSNGRIKKMMVYERGLKLAISYLYAFLAYLVVVLLLKLIWDINGLMPVYVSVLLLAILSFFTLLSVMIPCKRFLKQNTIELIK